MKGRGNGGQVQHSSISFGRDSACPMSPMSLHWLQGTDALLGWLVNETEWSRAGSREALGCSTSVLAGCLLGCDGVHGGEVLSQPVTHQGGGVEVQNRSLRHRQA
jgi:hypothetical protein